MSHTERLYGTMMLDLGFMALLMKSYLTLEGTDLTEEAQPRAENLHTSAPGSCLVSVFCSQSFIASVHDNVHVILLVAKRRNSRRTAIIWTGKSI